MKLCPEHSAYHINEITKVEDQEEGKKKKKVAVVESSSSAED